MTGTTKTETKGAEYLYRYEDYRQAVHMDSTETFVTVQLIRFEILTCTPSGVWIALGGIRRWVSAKSRKRYAYPTPDEAWVAYKHRKARQVSILRAKLKHAKEALDCHRPSHPYDNENPNRIL